MKFQPPIYPGAGVRLTAEFRDAGGTLQEVEEPVTMTVSTPDDQVMNLTAEKDAPGVYSVDIVATLAGVYNARAESSGILPAVDETSFRVSPSNV